MYLMDIRCAYKVNQMASIIQMMWLLERREIAFIALSGFQFIQLYRYRIIDNNQANAFAEILTKKLRTKKQWCRQDYFKLGGLTKMFFKHHKCNEPTHKYRIYQTQYDHIKRFWKHLKVKLSLHIHTTRKQNFPVGGKPT